MFLNETRRSKTHTYTSWDIPFESGRFQSAGGGNGVFSSLNQNCPWGQFEMHSTKTTVRRGLFEVENIFSNRNYDSMWHSDSFSAFCFFAFLVIYWKKRTLSCFLLIIYVQIRWFDVECKSERLNIHSFVKKIAVGHWPTSHHFFMSN